MKIYRLHTISKGVHSYHMALGIAADNPGSNVNCIKPGVEYSVLMRAEFVREFHLEGKALLKMLPAWAKAKFPPSIGHKVTAFYAINNKTITQMHVCGFPVGSDEYHDWVETQPDIWRSVDVYRRSIGELIA